MITATTVGVDTSDGRRLSGLTFGPPDGQPALFIAGAATGKSMSFGEGLLPEAGVRLLTMDRPGLGGSTPHPERTLASTVADYRAVVEAVVGRPGVSVPVVANSQGGVFGLAVAVEGLASRLVLVSPADELAHPAVHAMLPPAATGLADLAAAEPEQAEAVLGEFTAEAMERMVLDSAGPEDRACYSAPDFLARYRRSLAEGFAGDGAGYVRDTMIAMRPWELPLQEIRCPVRILFGAADLGHSPDHGATLAGRIPQARRVVLDDAGGALLWTHARAVFEAALPR